MKRFILLAFCCSIWACKKDSNTAGALNGTGYSGMLPTFSYKINGVTYIADSFQTILKKCQSCSNQKIYFYAFHNGVNNFQLEFLPYYNDHIISTSDACMKCIPPLSSKWISSSNVGSLKVTQLDTLNGSLQGQFSFTDSTYTISDGNFYSVKIARQ
jgi:hypothetical protein